MATAAVTLPKPRRRPAAPLAAGRASLPEIYFSKRIDNSRLVREMGLERCREYVSLLGLGILVFLCVLLISWQHLQCVRAGYEIEDLKAQRVTLQESNYQLRLRQAARADPQRIDTQARKLGMVSPSPQQVIPWGGTDVPSLSRAKSRPIVRPPTTVGDGNRREP